MASKRTFPCGLLFAYLLLCNSSAVAASILYSGHHILQNYGFPLINKISTIYLVIPRLILCFAKAQGVL
jgi:hypothetical protein